MVALTQNSGTHWAPPLRPSYVLFAFSQVLDGTARSQPQGNEVADG